MFTRLYVHNVLKINVEKITKIVLYLLFSSFGPLAHYNAHILSVRFILSRHIQSLYYGNNVHSVEINVCIFMKKINTFKPLSSYKTISISMFVWKNINCDRILLFC